MEPRRKFFSLFNGAVHFAPGATGDDVLKECGSCGIQFKGNNCPIASCRNIAIAVPFRGFSPVLDSPRIASVNIAHNNSADLDATPISQHCLVPAARNESVDMFDGCNTPMLDDLPEEQPETPESPLPMVHNDDYLRQCLGLATPLKAILDEVREKIFLNPAIDIRHKVYFDDMLFDARKPQVRPSFLLPSSSPISNPSRSPIFPPNLSPIPYPTPSRTPSPITSPIEAQTCTICGFDIGSSYRSKILQQL